MQLLGYENNFQLSILAQIKGDACDVHNLHVTCRGLWMSKCCGVVPYDMLRFVPQVSASLVIFTSILINSWFPSEGRARWSLFHYLLLVTCFFIRLIDSILCARKSRTYFHFSLGKSNPLCIVEWSCLFLFRRRVSKCITTTLDLPG